VEKSNYSGSSDIKLFLSGMVFSAGSAPGQSDAEIAEKVFEVVAAMMRQGINIVRGNGSGQKPRDIAKAVAERFGVNLTAHDVLDHLNRLERKGRLTYSPGGNHKRGQRAGYRLP
jgi:hypothetical protein